MSYEGGGCALGKHNNPTSVFQSVWRDRQMDGQTDVLIPIYTPKLCLTWGIVSSIDTLWVYHT